MWPFYGHIYIWSLVILTVWYDILKQWFFSTLRLEPVDFQNSDRRWICFVKSCAALQDSVVLTMVRGQWWWSVFQCLCSCFASVHMFAMSMCGCQSLVSWPYRREHVSAKHVWVTVRNTHWTTPTLYSMCTVMLQCVGQWKNSLNRTVKPHLSTRWELQNNTRNIRYTLEMTNGCSDWAVSFLFFYSRTH